MNKLTQVVASRVERALAAEAERLRQIVQDRISKPVGPNGERSKRGEPPRKDTGRLYTSASSQTIEGANTVQASVSVATPYARRLVREMDRPIFGPLLQQEKPAILGAIAGAIADRS